MATTRTTKKATKATRTKAKKAPAPKAKATDRPRDPRLPAVGSTIEKTFKGRNLILLVTPDGFELNGKSFSSLSAAARSATNYMVSGFVFFGLADSKPAKETEDK